MNINQFSKEDRSARQLFILFSRPTWHTCRVRTVTESRELSNTWEIVLYITHILCGSIKKLKDTAAQVQIQSDTLSPFHVITNDLDKLWIPYAWHGLIDVAQEFTSAPNPRNDGNYQPMITNIPCSFLSVKLVPLFLLTQKM